jgi:segregation and condensation protein A
VLSRSKVKLSHDVVTDRISISDRIVELTDIILARKRAVFEDLFEGITSRFDLVITFLALLEMTRLRITTLVQVDPLSPLYVEARVQEATDAEEAGAPLPAETEASEETEHGKGSEEDDDGGADVD